VPRPRALAILALFGLCLLASGCGGKSGEGPRIGVKGGEEDAAQELGFPAFATKNTTRVGGHDPVADAAGAAQAVFSARTPATQPNAVALVDKDDWRAGIAASLLMSGSLRAPVLLTDGDKIPSATQDALDALAPKGAKTAGGTQVIRIGDAPKPEGLRSVQVSGKDPFALARAIDRYASAADRHSSDRVVVVSADAPAYAMPAAAWAAKGGDPVLYVRRDALPAATRAAIVAHQQPRIYVLGPGQLISQRVIHALRRLGSVTRISAPDPVASSIAFARFADGSFGWGVVDPGHGLLFANATRPLDAAAAAPLAASGSYGPLLVVNRADTVPRSLEQYLLDIQPGYQGDPVRGVYNHAWLMGDDAAISVDAQSRIDSLLEIVPVSQK
jgi:hypothetical protein